MVPTDKYNKLLKEILKFDGEYAPGELASDLMFCDQCAAPVQVIAYNPVSQIMLFSI